MFSDIESNFESLLRNPNQNIDKRYSRYKENLDEMERKVNLGFLDDISQEFIKIFTRKIEQYYESFYGMSNRNFERNLDNIQTELRPAIRKVNEQFQEEYKKMIKIALKNNQSKMDNTVATTKEQEELIPEEEISLAARMLEYNNYGLIRQSGKLYVKDKKTKKAYELTYNKDFKLFDAKDIGLGIQIINGNVISVNIESNLSLVDDHISLEISDISRTDIIKVSQDFIGYDLSFNNKKASSPEEIMQIVEQIKARCPAYYNKLLQDPEFVEMLPTKPKSVSEELEELKEARTSLADLFMDDPVIPKRPKR